MPQVSAPIAEFRTAFSSAEVARKNIDTTAMTITDVLIAQAGEARGHGYYIEREQLEVYMTSANKEYPEGLPMKYGHNWNNLGKGLGRFSNLKMKGDRLYADAGFYKTADSSPTNPGMATYVLNQASEDPKSLMMSIKFQREGYYQYDKAKTKIKVFYYDEDNHQWVRPIKEFGKVYVEVNRAVSCDVVDDGALTESMFGTNSIQKAFSYLASLPGFSDWVKDHVESIPEIHDHFAAKQENKFYSKFKSFFTMKDDKPATPATPAATPAPATTSASTTPDTLTPDPSIADQLKAVSDKLEALQTRNDNLEASLIALGGEPAETPTGGTSEASTATDDTPAYMSDPINQRAMEHYSRIPKTDK